MTIRIQPGVGARRRAIAGVAALILIAAQLIAAAHFHQSRRANEITTRSHDLVCAVCVVRAHSPAASVATGAVFIPAVAPAAPLPTIGAGSLAPRVLRIFGRAPPASL